MSTPVVDLPLGSPVTVPAPRTPRGTQAPGGGSRRRTATSSPRSRVAGSTPGHSVGCVFCNEPIEISTFTIGAAQSRSATCPNCALLVSVSEPVWARWGRTVAVTEVDRGLAERLRARRVAVAARAILDRVVAAGELER